MADPVDIDDPCALATYLRSVRLSLIAGSRPIRVRHETANGTRKEVEYGPANLAALDREIERAERTCKALTDPRPRRYAMTPRQ